MHKTRMTFKFFTVYTELLEMAVLSSKEFTAAKTVTPSGA